ncbi:sugar ABC transporter substrate-binding protein [Leekyejoonella antrihumi]|uniref:Sugar ABC transporter substrate-binding protein n=1 Tax=Leekyejoonella antrihumi TaxID=1660198 RepID=A0A563DXT3_9MICO|nr:sugar ABC transporter substrate-binding protein [Leekyejoonella antrihumi]TWP34484.1 sugar ABC transporter substrate-binding protein [Leekyejoonella antrihumi]
MKRHMTTAAVGGIGLLTALAVAGCSTPSGTSTSSSVSTTGGPTATHSASALTGQPTPKAKSVKEIKMAFFSSATSNQYLQAGINSLKAYAKKEGFSLSVFDGKFNAQTQYDQIQNAITSGKYNAFVVEANDGNLVCNILTKNAPAAGIVVSVMNIPICGRDTNLGAATWEPGTITYVGGQTLDVYQQWVDQVKKDYPNGAKIAMIEGPQLGANSKNFDKATKAGFTGKWQVVAKQYTDYTTAQGFSAAQTIVQSHPDLNVMMSNYSGMSQGVVQATGGKNIAVYDFGGDKWSFGAVKSGKLKSTIIMLPREETVDSAKAVVNLVEGKPVKKFYNLTKDPKLGGKSPFVYKRTLDQYTPEY